MAVTFQIEKSDTWDAGMIAAATEAWKEIGHGFLKSINPIPDIETYKVLEDKGIVIGIAARDDGIFIGYCTIFITNKLHHKGFKKASCDSIFVKPDRRNQHIGRGLVAAAEKFAKEAGAGEMDFHVTKLVNFGSLLERIGYFPQSTTYSKVLNA